MNDDSQRRQNGVQPTLFVGTVLFFSIACLGCVPGGGEAEGAGGATMRVETEEADDTRPALIRRASEDEPSMDNGGGRVSEVYAEDAAADAPSAIAEESGPIDEREAPIPGKPIQPLTESCAALDVEWDAADTDFENEVLALTNEARAEPRRCGNRAFPAVPPVYTNESLRCAARLHSLDMVERAYFDHVSPDGTGPDVRATDAGYSWVAVGENIAVGARTPQDVVDGWLDSPGHCQNIMSESFDELGVGFSPRATARYGNYWTQVFGRR